MSESAQIISSALNDPIRTAMDFGCDIESLVTGASIDARAVLSAEGTVPLHRFVAFHQIAASRLSAPHFGRLASRRFDLASIGPTGVAALAAPTLGAGLRLVEQSFLAVQGETDLRLTVAEGLATLSYRILDPQIWPRDQDAELTIGVFAALVAKVAGPHWRPLGKSFEHSAHGAERHKGGDPCCPVEYLAETNSFSFEARLLDEALPHRDAALFAKVSSNLKRRVFELHRNASLAERVRWLIMRHLGTEAADQTCVAQSLGMSRRSLRRRLAELNTSFAVLLGDCRDDLARTLLKETRLTTAEIADRLGYSEASAFERAFRNRSGISPAQYRAQNRRLS